MDATTSAQLTDQATATAALITVRHDLNVSVDNLCDRTDGLRDLVVSTRPKGLLTVDEMATAVGRDRNYIDSIWSANGDTTKGKQTRVQIDITPGVGEAARLAYETLADAANALKRAASMVSTARAERDRVVALVYASKLLGPSAIAATVQVDRNHVLRIARKAGVPPVHRVSSKNQYTTTDGN